MTTSSFASPKVFIRQLPDEPQRCWDEARTRIADIVESDAWDRELESAFRRLRLDVGGRNQESALQLLAISHEALKTPSGAEPGAAAVLIPLREAIDRTLNDLLRRSPGQERTRNIRRKVESVCARLGTAGLPNSDVERLINEAAELIPELSCGKQQVFKVSEIQALFIRGKAFLRTLLEAIDEDKLRA